MPGVCHQPTGSSSGSWFSSIGNGGVSVRVEVQQNAAGEWETRDLVVEKAQIPVTKASGARSCCLAIDVTLFVLSLGKPDTLATCTAARPSKINWKANLINMIYQINSYNVL